MTSTERPDEELQALCDAASPAPWFVEQGGEFDDPFWLIGDVLRDRFGANSISSEDRATIEFIAAARSAVPSLLARVAAAEKKLARVEAECDRIERMPSRDPYNTFTGRGMALAATKIRAVLADEVTR